MDQSRTGTLVRLSVFRRSFH